MKLSMLTLFTLLLLNCRTVNASNTLQQDDDGGVQKVELPERKREAAIAALSIIFKDPKTGKEQTDAYKAYLTYKKERLELSKLVADAQEDRDKLALAQEMNDLDRGYRVKDRRRTTRNAVQALASAYYFLSTDKTLQEKMKQYDLAEYDEWQEQRKAIIKDLEGANSHEVYDYHASRQRQLDEKYQFQFMGFLLGVE